MPDHDPSRELGEPTQEDEDEEELAAAYAALDEDRRQQAELAARASASSQTVTREAAAEATAEPPPDVAGAPERLQSPAQTAHEQAAEACRRVFLIDGKEYPDLAGC